MAHQSDLLRPFHIYILHYYYSCSMFGFCLLFKIYSCDWMTVCVGWVSEWMRASKTHTEKKLIVVKVCKAFLSLTTHCRVFLVFPSSLAMSLTLPILLSDLIRRKKNLKNIYIYLEFFFLLQLLLRHCYLIWYSDMIMGRQDFI